MEHARTEGITKRSETELLKELRSKTAVNCWHQNPHESAAMWSQYLKSMDGIAIQSTYSKLISSFAEQDDSILIFVGMVQYIDYDKDMIKDFNNMLLPGIHKRTSFRHEQELRAVALGSLRRDGKTNLTLDLRRFPESGIDIKVNLTQLLDAIYVAPGTPNWFKLSIEAVLEKYGLSIPVKQSSLDDEPLW